MPKEHPANASAAGCCVYHLCHQPEPDFEAHLKLIDLAILQQAARFQDFEPVEVFECLVSALHGALNRVFNRLFRDANNFNKLYVFSCMCLPSLCSAISNFV